MLTGYMKGLVRERLDAEYRHSLIMAADMLLQSDFPSSSPTYPYDIRLESPSDTKPIGVRVTGPGPRDFLLQCGRCTDWVGHHANSINAASRSALSKHHTKSECRTVWRLIQSGTLTWTLNHNMAGPLG
jgi:hypothetical protein